MLAHSLYTEDDTTMDCCATVYCKCLNTKIGFINQSRINDDDLEYESLERCLDTQSGINSTLYFRAFLLSIDVKFKWLIGCTVIYDRRRGTPTHLYKCHGCGSDLFIGSRNVLGKSLINYELQNFHIDNIVHRPDYSALFNIVIASNEHSHVDVSQNHHIELSTTHPLSQLMTEYRTNEEMAMQQRIEEFKRKERAKFAIFCDQLQKEYDTLTQCVVNDSDEDENDADERSNTDRLFDIKLSGLVQIEKDFNDLMEENLKLDHDEVYQYLQETTCTVPLFSHDSSVMRMDNIASVSSKSASNAVSAKQHDWFRVNEMHAVSIKLPINELGEIPMLHNNRKKLAMDEKTDETRDLQDNDNMTDPPSNHSPNSNTASPSGGTTVEHEAVQRISEFDMAEAKEMAIDALYNDDDDDEDDEDENAPFTPITAISDEDDGDALIFAMDDEEEPKPGSHAGSKPRRRGVRKDSDEERDEQSDEASLNDSGNSIHLKMIPELDFNDANHVSTETNATMQTNGSRSFNLEEVDVIQEDSETDDGDKFALGRARSTAASTTTLGHSAKHYADYTSLSSSFKVKQSKARQINKLSSGQSLLAKTLNTNSALVNLKNRTQFVNTQETITKYHPQIIDDEERGLQDETTKTAKTYLPPKNWLDEKTSKSRSGTDARSSGSLAIKATQNKNGTLTVNNHTFKGIWAKTLTPSTSNELHRSAKAITTTTMADTTAQDLDETPIHAMYEKKRTASTNSYAYSLNPKHSITLNEPQ